MLTASTEGVLLAQGFAAETVMFPACPAPPEVTVIAVVPAPAVMTHPGGTAQLYVVASGTEVMLYNKDGEYTLGLCGPVITPGAWIEVGKKFIMIEFELTVAGCAQGRLLVSSQLTASPSAKVLLVYVLLLFPTLFPFSFH